MKYPHPVYQDGDHLYTICRDGSGYAITMIPADQGLSGVGHIISMDGATTLDGAMFALKDLARHAGLSRVTKSPSEAATSTEGKGKST